MIEQVVSWGQRVEPKVMDLLASISGDGTDWRNVVHVDDEGKVDFDLISYQGAKKLGIYLGNNMVLVASRTN